MFAAFFGIGAAGIYALANRVLSLPMSFIGNAVGQVFFSNAAQANREGKLAPLVVNLYSKLAQIAMPPAIILAIAGPELFSFVFGKEWTQAGEFARWMSPWLYFAFVFSPLSTIFSVIEKQGAALTFNLLLLGSRVGAMLLGAYCNDLTLTVILFSFVSALCYLGALFWFGYSLGNRVSVILKPTYEAFFGVSACAVPLVTGKLMNDSHESLWIYGLGFSFLLIAYRYWCLFRKAF
jgi:O-antigen/teichoic acid export membrane protein